jgi:hypothetical protein
MRDEHIVVREAMEHMIVMGDVMEAVTVVSDG